MSIGPSQFQRFVDAVLAELVSTKNSLQQHLGAIRDEQKTHWHRQEQTNEGIHSQLSAQTISPDEKRRKNAQRKIELWIQGAMAAFTLGAFIAAAVYAAIAHRQMCIMNKTYEEIQKQTNAAQKAATAAKDAANAASRQADIGFLALSDSQQASSKTLEQMKAQIETAQGANKIASDALEAQTRPWVGIEGEVIPVPDTQVMIAPRPGNPPVFIDSIDVKSRTQNYGGSVAEQVATVFMLYNGTKPNQAQFNSTGVCDAADRDSRKPDWLVNRISIFPKQMSGELRKTARCWLNNGCRVTPNCLVACISYQWNQIIYHTRLEYVIGYGDSDPDTGIHKISKFDLIYTGTDQGTKQQSK